MTSRERAFQQALATMYQRAAKGQEEYVWMQGRYERLKAAGWHTEPAFNQAQHEAQIRFHSRQADPEPARDVLRGMTLGEARSEYTRLCFRGEQLTVSLRQLVMTTAVRRNMERERDDAERAAHDLSCHIAEVEAQQGAGAS